MKTFEELVPEQSFIQTPESFDCPHCAHKLLRGGRADRILMAGIARHVKACRSVLLYRAGFVEVGTHIIAVKDLDPLRESHRHALRAARAMHNKRYNYAHGKPRID